MCPHTDISQCSALTHILGTGAGKISGPGAGEMRSPIKSAAWDIKGSPIEKGASPYSQGGLLSLSLSESINKSAELFCSRKLDLTIAVSKATRSTSVFLLAKLAKPP